MDLLFPQDECARMQFKDSAKKIGFEDLTVDCAANIHLLQPQDKIAVLLIAWKKIGDYLTHNQYTPCAGIVVSWVGRHTLDIWFDRDWIACSVENKTTLIEHMMKVYPAAYITMHPYSWPYMFSIYRDPWMVEYLNFNFQRMNDPDSPDAFDAKDSEFIQQEGISLVILRMIKMFDFGMVKLVKRICLRLLWTWHDETSTANRIMRATPNSSQYMNCIRHIYLIAIRDSNGNKDLLYVFECIKRNLHCNANETGPLESIALIIAKGLLECNTTLTEFLNTFLLGVPNVHLNNLFGTAVEKYVTFLTEYQLRKLHSQRRFLPQENVYTKLVKMFIRQRESSEDLMKEAAVVSEALFSGVNNLKALKYSYEQFKPLTRSEWQTTKVTLILGIICDVLNSLEEFKYIDDQEADELISKEQELATYYRDLAYLLKRTPYLEQEVWLTTFSLHPCKEYMDAVTKCGTRNLRAIKKQAFKLKPFDAAKPAIENSSEELNKNVNETLTSEKILEAVVAHDMISPTTSAAFLASLSTAGNHGQEPTKVTPMPVLAVQKAVKKPKVKKLPSESTEPIVKAKRGRPFGSTKASKNNMIKTPAIVTKKKPVTVKHEAKFQDTAEVIYSAAAGASENLSSRTMESLQYPTFALINSVTDTEALIKYTDYDDEELGQYEELNRILSNLRLQHSNHDDFLALLISPRYKRLTWTICWKILRKRCRELLTKDKKKTELVQQCMANANERLTYLNIDYEKYKDKPQIDYGSIENGYECFDTDSNDDTTLKPVKIDDPKQTKEKPLEETKPGKKKRTISIVKQSLSYRRAGVGKSIKKLMKGGKIERPSPAAQLIQKVENLGFRSTAFIEELSSKGCLSSPIYLDRPVYIVRMSPDDPNDFRTILTKDPKQLHRKSQIMAIDNSQTASQQEWVDEDNPAIESITKSCDNVSAGQNISQTSVEPDSDAQTPIPQSMPRINSLTETDNRININDKQQITSFKALDIPVTLSPTASVAPDTKAFDFSKTDKTVATIAFAQKDQPEDLTMPKVEKYSHTPMNLSPIKASSTAMKDLDSAQEPLNSQLAITVNNMQQNPSVEAKTLQKSAAKSEQADPIPLLKSPLKNNQTDPQSKLQQLLEPKLAESGEANLEQEAHINCLQIKSKPIEKFVASKRKTNSRSLLKCPERNPQVNTESLQSPGPELKGICYQNEDKCVQNSVTNIGKALPRYVQADLERNQVPLAHGPADLKLESTAKITKSRAHNDPLYLQKTPERCLQPDLDTSHQSIVVGQAQPEQGPEFEIELLQKLAARNIHTDPRSSQQSPVMSAQTHPEQIQKFDVPPVQTNSEQKLKEKSAEESGKPGTRSQQKILECKQKLPMLPGQTDTFQECTVSCWKDEAESVKGLQANLVSPQQSPAKCVQSDPEPKQSQRIPVRTNPEPAAGNEQTDPKIFSAKYVQFNSRPARSNPEEKPVTRNDQADPKLQQQCIIKCLQNDHGYDQNSLWIPLQSDPKAQHTITGRQTDNCQPPTKYAQPDPFHLQESSAIYGKAKSQREKALPSQCFPTDLVHTKQSSNIDRKGDSQSARCSPTTCEPIDLEPLQDSPLGCAQVGPEHSQILSVKCEKSGPEAIHQLPAAMPSDNIHCQNPPVKVAISKRFSTGTSPIESEQAPTQADTTSVAKVSNDENLNRSSDPARIIIHKDPSRSTQQQTQKIAIGPSRFNGPIKIVKISVPIPTPRQPTMQSTETNVPLLAIRPNNEKVVLSRMCGRIVAQVNLPGASSAANNIASSSNVLIKKAMTIGAANINPLKMGSQSTLIPEKSKELATQIKSDGGSEMQTNATVVSQLQEQDRKMMLPEESRSAEQNLTNGVEEISSPTITKTFGGGNKSPMVSKESISVPGESNVQSIASIAKSSANVVFCNAKSVDIVKNVDASIPSELTYQPAEFLVSEETKPKPKLLGILSPKNQITDEAESTTNKTKDCTLNPLPTLSVKGKGLPLTTFGIGNCSNGQIANLISTQTCSIEVNPPKVSKESTSAAKTNFIEETPIRLTPTQSKEKRKSPVESYVKMHNSESGKQKETNEIPCKMFKFDSDRNSTMEAAVDSPEPQDCEPSCSKSNTDRLLLQSTSTSVMTEQVNGNDDTNSSDFNISQLRSCTTDTLSSPTLSSEAKDDIAIDEENVYKGNVQWWLDRASVAIQRMFGPEKSADELKNVMEQLKQSNGDSLQLGPYYQMLHKIIQRGCRLTFDLAFIAELQKFINDENTKDNNSALVLLARANQEPDVILSLLKQNRLLDNTDISVHEIPNTYKPLTRRGLGNALLAPIVKVIVKGTTSANGDSHQTKCDIVKPYKALEDFVQARRLAHSPTMYSNVIATNTVHKLEVPTFDDMSADEGNELSRESSPRIHRSRKRHRTQSKIKSTSDDIPTQRTCSRNEFRILSTSISGPGTSSNILSSHRDDTDSDMEASDIYECDPLGNESESGSDYVPKRTRQKLVRPMRLRCVSRRLASYALSSCPSPIVTRRQTTNSNINNIKKCKATAGNTFYQLTSSDKCALKRHNCMDLKVKLNRLTVRDASMCRRTYVRLTRHIIDLNLKSGNNSPKVALRKISSPSHRTRASERNKKTKEKVIECRKMLNGGTTSESEEDEDDDETSSFNLLIKDWRTDDDRHNEDDDDANARAAHQNTFANENFVSTASSASTSDPIKLSSNSSTHTRKNNLGIGEQIGFLLNSDATSSHESDVKDTTEEVHNSNIDVTNRTELNSLPLSELYLLPTCQETVETPDLVEDEDRVSPRMSNPMHTTTPCSPPISDLVVDPVDFHSDILDQQDEAQSAKSRAPHRASSPELLDHLVEPDPLSLDRQAMVSPRTLLVTNRPRFLITPPLELFDDPVESYSRFLVQQNKTPSKTVSAVCIAKPYQSPSFQPIDDSIVSNGQAFEPQDILSPQTFQVTNQPEISAVPTPFTAPMPEIIIEKGDRVPVCESQPHSSRITDVVIKLT